MNLYGVNGSTTLLSAMNKYPPQWVDGICSALEIVGLTGGKKGKVRASVWKLESGYVMEVLEKKLNERHLAALRMLLENDWVMKYGQIARQFSSDSAL